MPEWVKYDNEIKQLLRHIEEQEDTATQKQTPPPSQHEKGLQTQSNRQCIFYILSISPGRTRLSYIVHFPTLFPVCSVDNRRDEL